MDEDLHLGVPVCETNSVFALVHSWFLPASPANTSHLYPNKRCGVTFQDFARCNHSVTNSIQQSQGSPAGGILPSPSVSAEVAQTPAGGATAPVLGVSEATQTPSRSHSIDSDILGAAPVGRPAEPEPVVLPAAATAAASPGPQRKPGEPLSAAAPATPEQGSKTTPGNAPLRPSARAATRPHPAHRLAASLAAAGEEPPELTPAGVLKTDTEADAAAVARAQVGEHPRQRNVEAFTREGLDGAAQLRVSLSGPGSRVIGGAGSETEEATGCPTRSIPDTDASGSAAAAPADLGRPAASAGRRDGFAFPTPPLGAGPWSEPQAGASPLPPRRQSRSQQSLQQREDETVAWMASPATQAQPRSRSSQAHSQPQSQSQAQSQLGELARLRSEYAALQRQHEALRGAYSAEVGQREGVVRRQGQALAALRQTCMALQSRTREVLALARMQGEHPLLPAFEEGAERAAGLGVGDEGEGGDEDGGEGAAEAAAAGGCVVCAAWRGVVERAAGLEPAPFAAASSAGSRHPDEKARLCSGCGCSGAAGKAAVTSQGRVKKIGAASGQSSPPPPPGTPQQQQQRLAQWQLYAACQTTQRRPSPAHGYVDGELLRGRGGGRGRGDSPGASGMFDSSPQRAPARSAAAWAL